MSDALDVSTQESSALGVPLASALLIDVGKALAKQLASKIGAEIINQIFGNSSLNYDQLLEDIRNIVREENAKQTARDQGGYINGLIINIHEIYIRDRDDGKSRKELFNLLDKTFLFKLNTALGVVQQEDLKQFGLPIYIQGASVKFCVLQEMILKDPKHSRHPEKSSIVPIYTQFFTDAIKHVSSLQASIWEDRLSKITQVKSSTQATTGFTSSSFKDNFSGKTYKATGIESKQKMQQRRDELIQELTDDVAWIHDVVEQWKQAQQNPLAFLDEA